MTGIKIFIDIFYCKNRSNSHSQKTKKVTSCFEESSIQLHTHLPPVTSLPFRRYFHASKQLPNSLLTTRSRLESTQMFPILLSPLTAIVEHKIKVEFEFVASLLQRGCDWIQRSEHTTTSIATNKTSSKPAPTNYQWAVFP